MKKFFKPGPNWLLIFIPISFALEAAHAWEPLIIFSAALSIIPIAKLIVHSTEQLATYTGDAIGGLLNATFGNFPELIIAVVALKAGLYTMVLASIVIKPISATEKAGSNKIRSILVAVRRVGGENAGLWQLRPRF